MLGSGGVRMTERWLAGVVFEEKEGDGGAEVSKRRNGETKWVGGGKDGRIVRVAELGGRR